MVYNPTYSSQVEAEFLFLGACLLGSPFVALVKYSTEIFLLIYAVCHRYTLKDYIKIQHFLSSHVVIIYAVPYVLKIVVR